MARLATSRGEPSATNDTPQSEPTLSLFGPVPALVRGGGGGLLSGGRGAAGEARGGGSGGGGGRVKGAGVVDARVESTHRSRVDPPARGGALPSRVRAAPHPMPSGRPTGARARRVGRRRAPGLRHAACRGGGDRERGEARGERGARGRVREGCACRGGRRGGRLVGPLARGLRRATCGARPCRLGHARDRDHGEDVKEPGEGADAGAGAGAGEWGVHGPWVARPPPLPPKLFAGLVRGAGGTKRSAATRDSRDARDARGARGAKPAQTSDNNVVG